MSQNRIRNSYTTFPTPRVPLWPLSLPARRITSPPQPPPSHSLFLIAVTYPNSSRSKTSSARYAESSSPYYRRNAYLLPCMLPPPLPIFLVPIPTRIIPIPENARHITGQRALLISNQPLRTRVRDAGRSVSSFGSCSNRQPVWQTTARRIKKARRAWLLLIRASRVVVPALPEERK